MALQKNPVNINFAKGVDTKSDPFQLQMDSFALLTNSVFTKTGRLTKRNGYANLTTIMNGNTVIESNTTLTTLNDNLLATGSNLYAYSSDTNSWSNQGIVQPVGLNTLPLLRSGTSQVSPDIAVAPSSLSCLVYVDSGVAYYQVSDTVTGQQIVPRTAIGSSAGNPRVFILGQYFLITYLRVVGSTPRLSYLAIPYGNPSSTPTAGDISSTVLSNTAPYDAAVLDGILYAAWSTSDSGGSVRAVKLSATLIVSSSVVIASGVSPFLIAVNTDETAQLIWVSYYAPNTISSGAYNPILNAVVAQTTVSSGVTVAELSAVSRSGINYLIYEVLNTYASPFPATGIKTDFIIAASLTPTTVGSPGTAGDNNLVRRSVGLASKPFVAENGNIYFMAAYGEGNQPTYFLLDISGNIYMRLAYSNGGGYAKSFVLPSVTLLDDVYYCPYLITDYLATVNKGTNNPVNTQSNAIFTQTGINLAKFTINLSGQYSSEIAGSLFLTGGLLWQYDGVKPVEDGFNVWPDNVESTSSTTGGSISSQLYYYVFTYEWTDNAGNLIRSAPSIPISIDLTSSGSSTNTNTLYVPTLRLTAKISPNPVRIVGYRWSVGQQQYYQFTSLTSPVINDPTVDYVIITDTNSDAQILGNVLLYTTGGVIENIAPPPSIHSALFNNRLFLIDAEDQNLLWFSKQVIEDTPVEMSDLLTIYVAPTTGAQGSTGPMTALSAMDDKLIIFKKDAIYYINGIGPDNTGANSTFSDPVFITATVGTSNPNSIVLTPNGIMFQSDKGIWLLGRDLSTTYIGAPVENYNNSLVLSAKAIPGTNQVRFVIEGSTTLMYDYYFGQWSTFSNVRAISTTLYQGKDTYLNDAGKVFQETQGIYLDGSTPVLLSITSAWINLAGLQGFERFYQLLLLGTYFTPYKLNVQFAYNYNPSPSQATLVTPDNYAPAWGGEAVWGSGGPWGGSEGNVFTARIFPQIQKCSSFQVTIEEVYDPSLGVPAGQSFSLSGMQLLIGVKKGTRTSSAVKSFG